MTELSRLVVPAERWLMCNNCQRNVKPRFSMSGQHVRADCSDCGRYIKFAKQIIEHPEELEPDLYVEELPW